MVLSEVWTWIPKAKKMTSPNIILSSSDYLIKTWHSLLLQESMNTENGNYSLLVPKDIPTINYFILLI